MKLIKDKQAVIWDLDGTLINSEAKLRGDVTGAFRRLGVEIRPEDVSGDWYALAAKYGISGKEFDHEFRRRKSWEDSISDGEVTVFPETLPALESLRELGVTSAILSKSYPDITRLKLSMLGLEKYFARAISVEPRKDSKKEIMGILLAQELYKDQGVRKFCCAGDKAEDALISYPINSALSQPTFGVLLPNRLTGEYEQIPERKGYNIYIMRTPLDVVDVLNGVHDGY